MSTSKLELVDIVKTFGPKVATDHLSLSVASGEFLTLLGPSGCGKTTLMRIITGSVGTDSGRILMDGQDITQVPTHRRNMGMVFQSFALFPHLTVAENVAFPLVLRGVALADRQQRVMEALRLVHLEELAASYPRNLSGGQQQRVGLARAIVYHPSVLLLDEPLSNLDAKLRSEMRSEISQITRSLGMTSVYVTHDQQEALALSDRIAVMNRGRVVQIGTPREIYERPKTRFVADFIGASNFFRVERHLGRIHIEGQPLELHIADLDGTPDGLYTVFVRPTDIALSLEAEGQPGDNRLPCQVLEAMFMGERIDYVLEVAKGVQLRAHGLLDRFFERGTSLFATIAATNVHSVEDDADWHLAG